uniref:Anti_prolifrtn domain-containing protein n=1 Tax=Elaeophora elaphi TaxID=1147741 RepID=A0A0R3RLZ9_9BILA
MYTEVKELINFLGIYMHHRIPRRRICLFMESYGNHLAGKFFEDWKLEEPKYGERERTLAIRTGNGLDEMFTTIATSIGIVEDDLAACFPSPMLLRCNPGEVSCQMMSYAHIITIWMGDVNADINYTPMPAGIAFFCETPTVLYNFLNSNGNFLSGASEFISKFSSKNKELKSQRYILLKLISCMDDDACDLLSSGFLFENRVPPFLFRYPTNEKCPFTARIFADTRFGSHRPRPDHQAMRRIQHAAAFLAVTNDSTCVRDNHPYVKHNFSPIILPSVPLTSSTAANISAGPRKYDAVSSMTASANAITETVSSNKSNHLLLNPSLSNPLPESIGSNVGRVDNQLYSLSPTMKTGSDFSSWYCQPAAGDTKAHHPKIDLPTCDKSSDFHLTYPCHSGTSVAGTYNPYSFDTDRESRSFSHGMNPNELIFEIPSFLSFSSMHTSINCTASERSKNQIHNLKSNNSDIAELQYNINRMSFTDSVAQTSSTFATDQPKIN